MVTVGLFATGYWLMRRREWDWGAELPVAVCLSALATPYGFWACDHALLLIPVLQAGARLADRGSRGAIWGLGLLYAAVAVEVATGFRLAWQYGWHAALTLLGWAVAMWLTGRAKEGAAGDRLKG